MSLAPAAGNAAATVTQPQRAADRGWDRSAGAADIEDLAGFAYFDIHARAVAGEQAGHVQRNWCAVTQEAPYPAWALLELLFGGHDDELVSAAQRPGVVVLQIGLRDAHRGARPSLAYWCPSMYVMNLILCPEPLVPGLEPRFRGRFSEDFAYSVPPPDPHGNVL